MPASSDSDSSVSPTVVAAGGTHGGVGTVRLHGTPSRAAVAADNLSHDSSGDVMTMTAPVAVHATARADRRDGAAALVAMRPTPATSLVCKVFKGFTTGVAVELEFYVHTTIGQIKALIAVRSVLIPPAAVTR